MHYFISVGVCRPNGFSPNTATMGVHSCTGFGCEKKSCSFDLLLPCGLATNTLAVHYLMYHRSEVPVTDLQKIEKMECDSNFSMADYDESRIGGAAWKMLEDARWSPGKRYILPFDFDKEKLTMKKGGYTVKELQEILTYVGMNFKGKKSELIERIREIEN